jgi:hypothetical protein
LPLFALFSGLTACFGSEFGQNLRQFRPLDGQFWELN